jgi:hypothetical protein
MVKKGIFVFAISLLLLVSLVSSYQTEIRVKGVPYYDAKINVMNDNPAFGSTVVERLRGELNENGDGIFILECDVPEFYFKTYLYDLGDDVAFYEVFNNSGENYLAGNSVYLQLIPDGKNVPITPVDEILTWEDALNGNFSEINLTGSLETLVDSNDSEDENDSLVVELYENETGEVVEILEVQNNSDDPEIVQPVTGNSIYDVFSNKTFYYVVLGILIVIAIVILVYFLKKKKKKKTNFEMGEIVEDPNKPKIVVRKLSEVRREQLEKKKQDSKSDELLQAEKKLLEAQELLNKLKGEKAQTLEETKPQEIGKEVQEDTEEKTL